MKSLPPSAPAIRRTCSPIRRTRTREQLNQAGAAMRELGTVLDETKPDVILFLGSDHVETFSPTCIPAFCIIAGSKATARFAGREIVLPIHREMAEDILTKLVTKKNFDVAYSEDAELGHAFAVPFEYVIGKRDIPVIPFFTNVYVPPLPTPQRCAAFGKAMAEIVKGRKERVAIIASGGMSHFPGTTKYLHPGVRLRSLDGVSVRGGQRRRAAQHDRTAARRSRQHGDAELGGDVRRDRRTARRADRLHSDLASRSGDDAVPAAAGAQNGADESRRAVRRIQVPEPGLPVLQASASRGLRPEQAPLRKPPQRGAARSDCEQLRCGGEGVRAAPPQRKAAEEMINVGKGGLVSEHVGPLVEAGAHPLQALMSLHVIFSTSHRATAAQAAQTDADDALEQAGRQGPALRT